MFRYLIFNSFDLDERIFHEVELARAEVRCSFSQIKATVIGPLKYIYIFSLSLSLSARNCTFFVRTKPEKRKQKGKQGVTRRDFTFGGILLDFILNRWKKFRFTFLVSWPLALKIFCSYIAIFSRFLSISKYTKIGETKNKFIASQSFLSSDVVPTEFKKRKRRIIVYGLWSLVMVRNQFASARG